jgi:hypothetical protein
MRVHDLLAEVFLTAGPMLLKGPSRVENVGASVQ